MLDLSSSLFLIHIPKTGGSSIEVAHGFTPNTKVPNRTHVLLRHQNARELFSYLEKNRINQKITVFSIIRNAYDRIKSTYRHHLKSLDESGLGDQAQDYSFDQYVDTIRRFHESEGVSVHKERVFRDEWPKFPAANFRHIQTLNWWLEGLADECIFLNFESLERDYNSKISSQSGVKSIPRHNVTPKKYSSVSCEYGEETANIISDIFGDEIIRFNMEKRAKVGDALRGGISRRCRVAVNSLLRKGYAT
ncbi:MAG: hypothetical protein HLUCCA12_12265, partial [Rhodobacteraceae bacterium HLUCCA12]